MTAVDRRGVIGVATAAISAAGLPSANAQEKTVTGQKCLLLGPDGELADAIAQDLTAAGGSVKRMLPDAATEDAYKAALANEAADIIVNLVMPEANGAFGDVDLPGFRRVMEATYIRTFLAMKYGIPRLRAGGGGRFITVTSNAGRRGASGAVAATAATNGIMQMTRCATLNCAAKDDNVRVNALMVGTGSAAEIASAVTFLASEAAIFYTGILLQLDDGAMS
ncbi:MAG: SDR family oxidoreductase [Alphaproteobacteria bacterium]|nr:SDR family oxidoreductase [Alphaproteobacteria bacterium]